MKKHLLGIFRNFRVVFFFAIFSFTFFSCSLFEEEEPFKPGCEINGTGTVVVNNETGETIIVDVTWGNLVNDERTIYEGGGTIYLDVPAGDIEIWVSFDGVGWAYQGAKLKVCEDMEYTWDYRIKDILKPESLLLRKKEF